MVQGTFIFLLLIFSSPQKLITNQMEGYWVVTEDYSEEARESWQRIFLFKECSNDDRKGQSCRGEYGWALDPGIYLNLFDRNFITYGVDNKSNSKTKQRQLKINDSKFDFVLDLNKNTLILTEEGKTILSMRKVKNREINAAY